MTRPTRIAVTGAAGNIGYNTIFRIAAGELLGPEQPVILQLIEVPAVADRLKGTVMELVDCAFPLLQDVTVNDNADDGFKDADIALLIGAKPRGAGMERKDLIAVNAEIFSTQGCALNTHASRSVRVVVIGNPANTNALIASSNAPDLQSSQFCAMTRLDHSRALNQVAEKTNTPVSNIRQMTIWGNHSSTQYPDANNCLINGKPAAGLLDQDWLEHEFIPSVQQRGAVIIKERGASSAASAATAAIRHTRDWVYGTPPDDWTSASVAADGSYGIPEGVFFSYPVRYIDGQYQIVQGLSLDEFGNRMLKATHQELLEERDAIKHLLT